MDWCEATNEETKVFLTSLQWDDLSGELIMDVGCGLPNMSTQCLLERYPRVGKIVAIDKDPYCIQNSREKCKKEIFKKAEFHCASITDWKELEKWKGTISKILSVHCISFVKRQRRAFRHMFELLKPGGEAGLLFVLRSESDDVYLEMAKKPKWLEYFRSLNTRTVMKHRQSDPTHYSNMLKEIGFLVRFCREQVVEYVFHDDDEYKDGVLNSAFIEKVPRELQEEFVAENFSTFLELHPRNVAGNLSFKYVMIEVLVEKDETVETA